MGTILLFGGAKTKKVDLAAIAHNLRWLSVLQLEEGQSLILTPNQ